MRDHLEQREVGQKAGVQLFHIVQKFNQVNVSSAQPVANQVVLSVALQHLVNWRDQVMTQTIRRGPLLLLRSLQPDFPTCADSLSECGPPGHITALGQ